MLFNPDILREHLDNAVQAAAKAAKPLVGCGDKIAIDAAAVKALRESLNAAPISGTVIVGEGEADGSAFLYNGEKVGAGGMEIDIAVDPIDGTRNAANNTPNAVSILAASPKGTMISCPDVKMQKLILRPGLNFSDYHLEDDWEITLRKLAAEIGVSVAELRICCYVNSRYPVVLNRDPTLLPTLRKLGITPLEVPNEWPQIPALCRGGIDAMMGVGGAPEAVIATAALIEAGGHIQGRFYADNVKDFPELDTHTVHNMAEIISGHQAVFAMATVTELIDVRFGG